MVAQYALITSPSLLIDSSTRIDIDFACSSLVASTITADVIRVSFEPCNVFPEHCKEKFVIIENFLKQED